jgi:beta-mannosidase
MTATELEVTFRSSVFLHAVCFDLPGIPHTATDNYFDLYLERPKIIQITTTRPFSAATVRKRLSICSLVDSYE